MAKKQVLGERTKKALGDSLVHDAVVWWASGRRSPRKFKREANTAKTIGAKIGRANDDIFAQQNEDSDESLIAFYEERAARYDVLDRLPWREETKE